MPHPILKLLSAAVADTPDAELLARFAASRDGCAFAEIVRRHGPTVYRVCRRLVGPTAADDAFQSTFLVLACRAQTVRKAGSVGSWLIGVAGRVARQMRARDRRGAGAGWVSEVSLSSPDAGLLATELAMVLEEELTRLPDSLRGPLVLCLVEGRAHAQAATALGVSTRTVRRRLDQAKALLRLRLERRGVVPVIAAGLVAGVGGPLAAVPSGVIERTVEGTFQFFTGGGALTPAAIVAKGVVGSMVKMRTASLMVLTTVAMIGLGMGLAEGPPASAPQAPTPGPKAEAPPTIPARPPEFTLPPLEPPPTPAGPGAVQRTGHFVVHAPTAVIARAVAAEAEFVREESMKRWHGAGWAVPCEIRVKIEATPGPGAYSLDFPRDPTLVAPPRAPQIELRGSFESILTTPLPRAVTHAVLVSALPKPPPPWAIEGFTRISDPDDEQYRQDAICRRVIADGRAIRFEALFRMTTPTTDPIVIQAQAHSVVRYLLTRQPNDDVGADAYGPQGRSRAAMVQGRWVLWNAEDRYDSLLKFVWLGMIENTSESWEQAAKEVYGVESVAWLEKAWLGWIGNPSKSTWKPAASPAAPTPGAGIGPPAPEPPKGLPVAPPGPDLPKPSPVGPPPDTLIPAPGTIPGTSGKSHFTVHAPTPEVAQRVRGEAERLRKGLALLWLGKELPDWPQPCSIKVKITTDGGGGFTSFPYAQTALPGVSGITSAEMEIQGALPNILRDCLPHEMLHTVLATYFGKPVPRWADEGIAVAAESDEQRFNHDVKAREYINAGRGIRLAVLFPMTEYPRDMHVLYAQGYSVVDFLLNSHSREGVPPLSKVPYLDLLGIDPKAQTAQATDSRRRLLAFVRAGTEGNTLASWDKAAKEAYGFDSVDALEAAWLDRLRQPTIKPNVAPRPRHAVPKSDTSGLIPPTPVPATPPSQLAIAKDLLGPRDPKMLPVAIALLEQIADKKPSPEERESHEQALLQLGHAKLQQDDCVAAEARLRTLGKLYPTGSEALVGRFLLGVCLIQRGKPDLPGMPKVRSPALDREKALKEALGLFQGVIDEFKRRRQEGPLTTRDEWVDTQAKLRIPQTYFWMGKFNDVLLSTAQLQQEFRGRVEELIALSYMWLAFKGLNQPERMLQARSEIVDLYAKLKDKPGVFSSGIKEYTREFWEEWLNTSSKAPATGGPAPGPAPPTLPMPLAPTR